MASDRTPPLRRGRIQADQERSAAIREAMDVLEMLQAALEIEVKERIRNRSWGSYTVQILFEDGLPKDLKVTPETAVRLRCFGGHGVGPQRSSDDDGS